MRGALPVSVSRARDSSSAACNAATVLLVRLVHLVLRAAPEAARPTSGFAQAQ